MGNKVPEELVSTVRSIVGDEYTEMDIIRALHMANNDATAAINIIFDTPGFKKLEFRKTSEVPNLNSSSGTQSLGSTTRRSSSEDKKCERSSNSDNGSQQKTENRESNNGCRSDADGCEMESEWWFVGTSEVSGLSTCKGRSLKPGDEVYFTFPAEKKLNSPSLGKFGRGRQVVACSGNCAVLFKGTWRGTHVVSCYCKCL